VNWPSFFPPQCPPLEARDASAEVFRLVSSNPAAASDFESLAQRRPQKWGSNCKASGLSVFTAKSDALQLMRRVPGMSAPGKVIASANLSLEAGKLMHTPRDGNSHHTWWAPAGFNHTAAFKVVI
jgi:hypothetical protein